MKFSPVAAVVPFGKYKGRPVEEMLADSAYMAWLEAQPWFREKFGGMMSAQNANEAMSCTPVHNRLQTLFLSKDYQMAFLRVAAPRLFVNANKEFDIARLKMIAQANKDALETEAEIRTLEKKITELQAKIDAGEQSLRAVYSYSLQKNVMEPGVPFQNQITGALADIAKFQSAIDDAVRRWSDGEKASIQFKTNAVFESGFVDVLITAYDIWDELELAAGKNPHGWRRYSGSAIKFPIEIKPTVADEYPAVLRQMNRHQSEYLFIGEYQGEGATQEQFVEIFAASGKKVVFKRNVDLMANPNLMAEK